MLVLTRKLGEILKLKWEQVDLRYGFILLNDTTKNNERREIPINSTLRETLDVLPRSYESVHIFTTSLRRADIRDFTFYDLRHTFASQLEMSGADLTTVKELLGHKSISMTLRYEHLAPSYKVKAVKTLDKKIDSAKKDELGLINGIIGT